MYMRFCLGSWITSRRVKSAGGQQTCKICGAAEGDELQHYVGCAKLWGCIHEVFPWFVPHEAPLELLGMVQVSEAQAIGVSIATQVYHSIREMGGRDTEGYWGLRCQV